MAQNKICMCMFFFNAGHVHTCTVDSLSLLSSLSEHTVVLVMIKHVAWSSACVYIGGQIPKHDKLSVIYKYVCKYVHTVEPPITDPPRSGHPRYNGHLPCYGLKLP